MMLAYVDPRSGTGKDALWSTPTANADIVTPFGADIRWFDEPVYRGMLLQAAPHQELKAPVEGLLTLGYDPRLRGMHLAIQATNSRHILYGLGSYSPDIRTGAIIKRGQPVAWTNAQGIFGWSVMMAGLNAELLERWVRLPVPRRALKVLSGYVKGALSDDDFGRWLTSVERGGAAWIDADQGLLATSLRGTEEALEWAGRKADELTSPDSALWWMAGAGVAGVMTLALGLLWRR